MAALLPLSDTLEPLRQLSPWDWAFGGDPLVVAAEPWRYVAPIVPALVLGVIAVLGVTRRDIRAA